MTTSPITPQPSEKGPAKALVAVGEHWFEMTATINPEASEEFANWMDEQLLAAEAEWVDYQTPSSLKKSLR